MSDTQHLFFESSLSAEDTGRALENGEFIPYFQPIVRLETGKLTGFEILARWKHCSAGIVLPDHFIPHAEEHDWIDTLTRHLLERAFTSIENLPRSLDLSINVSPVQFHNPKLAELIQETADRSGFDLQRLIVEVTESAAIKDLSTASLTVRKLKKLGCRISLDDFGMGYSGMFHLNALPFDELKIDRSFVSSLLVSWESRAIVGSFIELARSRNLRIVAEGIETRSEADMLLGLGCRFGQGWLYGKPSSAVDLPAIVSCDDMPEQSEPKLKVDYGLANPAPLL